MICQTVSVYFPCQAEINWRIKNKWRSLWVCVLTLLLNNEYILFSENNNTTHCENLSDSKCRQSQRRNLVQLGNLFTNTWTTFVELELMRNNVFVRYELTILFNFQSAIPFKCFNDYIINVCKHPECPNDAIVSRQNHNPTDTKINNLLHSTHKRWLDIHKNVKLNASVVLGV